MIIPHSKGGDLLIKFDLQLFGGGGPTVTQRALSPEETQLIAQQAQYMDSIQPAVAALVSRGTSALEGVITPDYNSIYSNAQKKSRGVSRQIDELAAGKLPSSYTNNKKDYYNQLYGQSFGSGLNNASQKNVINSSVLNKSIDTAQKNLYAQMSQDYSKDMATQSQLLSQKQADIYTPLSLGSAINSATFGNASQYLNLASGQQGQGNDTLTAIGNLNNGRTYVTQQSDPWGSVLGGAAMGWACFIAGTKINMPEGEKNIEDIKVGDVIVTKDDDGNDVEETVIWVQEPKFSADDYMTIEAEDLEVTTTSTQEFKMLGGFRFPADMLGAIAITDTGLKVVTNMREACRELVYDFATTGSNTYIANGFIVKGAFYNDVRS